MARKKNIVQQKHRGDFSAVDLCWVFFWAAQDSKSPIAWSRATDNMAP